MNPNRYVHTLLPILSLSLATLVTVPLLRGDRVEAKPFAQSGERGFARMIYFTESASNPIAGEFWIQYGQPEWKPDYEKALEKNEPKRWRFGKDAWTSFDTNIEVTVGGQKLAPGMYYMALEHPAKDKWNLVFLDPAPLRNTKMDAFGAASVQGGIVAPLTHSTAEKAADRLTISFTAGGKKPTDGSIDIAFGPHKLSVPFTTKL